jgi:glycosyltransferase involved in cell wall biosynthesis
MMRTQSKQTLLSFARVVYHRLPLSLAAKWRLRAILQPVLMDLLEGRRFGISPRAIGAVLRPSKYGGAHAPDYDLEHALAAILQDMAAHTRDYGAPRVWIALPFLATGGAEWVALSLCRAVRQLRSDQSVVLLVTDRKLLSERMELPPGVLLVVLDDYLDEPLSYERKQALLRDLLVAGRPHAFHNINSEVAWNLILAEGERLKRYTRLYASIFAFQFAPDDRTKIGYAAYFLKKGMPHLAGLLSDNRRFIADAAREYDLPSSERERMGVLYQPCRLPEDDFNALGMKHLQRRHDELQTSADGAEGRRPQVLWAGRLDAEKRMDLFLEIVRRCSFADFRVYGQVVLDDEMPLPSLPNLSYEGAFTSPMEWLGRYAFDAFVFTSRWEGMPNILLEVGALGIPVIAPTVGGVGELVDETTGYPLPERPSAIDYEQALRRIVTKPTEALERAQRLHALVQQRHSWDSFVAGVAAVADYLPLLEAMPDSVPDVHTERGWPLVSVIVPCFNQGRYLQQAVASALAACKHPLEIIVVDDGSSDPSIARHLAEAELLAPSVVRIHRQANQGLSGARNSGIALARGEYLQFLDADDVLVPGKIDAQVAQLEVNPELHVSVCNYLLCDETRGMFTKTEEAIARFEISVQDFLYRWERGFVIPIHCGLFRSGVLREHRFDTQARAKEDWLFWTSLSMAGMRFGYVHGHWAIYRQHESSMRRSYVSMGQSWLQAGLKIDEMLGGREPLFFESVVAWFEQNYRSHPHYRVEIAQRQAALAGEQSLATVAESGATMEPAAQVRLVAESILNSLVPLAAHERLPMFSVVVPIYGHFEYLQVCLESLAEQGDVSFEVICIDDGSPDARVSLLMDALRDRNPRLLVRREAVNRGVSVVQNLAVELARGEYVAFLDCDDALAPHALQTLRVVLQDQPEVDYLFTDRVDVNEKGQTVRIARYGGYERLHFKSQDRIPDDLFDGMVASHLKVIRRSVYRELGGCDARFSGVQDWELALRIAQRHRLYYLAEPLYLHRVHTCSVTLSDNVGQLCKTNVVLRLYLERWRASSTVEPSVHMFSSQEFPVPMAQLKSVWKRNGRCVADVRGPVTISHINFLREFNAYFDQIVWSEPWVPAALYGYLCPAVVLVRDLAKSTESPP